MKRKKMFAVADVLLTSAVLCAAGYAALGDEIEFEGSTCCKTVTCNIPGGTNSTTVCTELACTSNHVCDGTGHCSAGGNPTNVTAFCAPKP